MKKIIKSLIIVTIFLTGLLSIRQVRAEIKKTFIGYTIVSVEDLYQACLAAQKEFKDRPHEIGNSVCGAFIQGFVSGAAISALHIFHLMPEDSNIFYYKQFAQNFCIDNSVPLADYIDSFVLWRGQHMDFNDASYSGFLASLYDRKECKARNANLDRAWEKYNGKN